MIGMGMVNPISNTMGNIMQQNTPQPIATPVTPIVNSTKQSNDEIIELLKKLGELKASGILTDEEFDAKKKELLNKIS
jgi:hypothetical protein